VVLVTGAGGGIGRDFALALAREGAKVVVNDLGASLQGEGRDTARAQAVVDDIKAAGGQAVANGDSVSDWDGANRMVTQAVDTFGRIDAVINNAGILRMSPEEWRAVSRPSPCREAPRSFTTTLAPSRASASAKSRPMPPPAPVTSTTLSWTKPEAWLMNDSPLHAQVAARHRSESA
ncbi:MAG: SDR family NAD(P)-dependent oxidoreductase, partial [Betaproteobacteria bacterium]|nr:SDR family NAD(P)-dependent oxidoreductase [Betaproteobacteria bacterium]